MDENLYMMWLSRSMGLNIKKATLLLEKLEKASEIYKCSDGVLLTINGIKQEHVKALAQGRIMLPKWAEELQELGLEFISVNSERFPKYLKFISDPPIGIYVKGHLFDAEEIHISMIGARRCSEYGRHMAYNLAKQLAAEGFVIVSGMAKGIDALSHKGALDAGGKTVAVLGFGHKHCYPAENRELMKQIAENGCLISEYAPDMEPLKYLFPQRNRIIAGISEGLIVIEAGEKSGTLTTVDFALEEGRHVMTIPANLTSKTAKGTNDLIKQGCPIILNVDDVYFELGKANEIKKKKKDKKIEIKLGEQEKLIYDLLENKPMSLDSIIQHSNMPVQNVQYVLTLLELEGIIQRQQGDRYMKTL